MRCLRKIRPYLYPCGFKMSGASIAFAKQTPNQNPKPRGFSHVVFLLIFFFSPTNFHIVNKERSSLYSSFALSSTTLGNYQGVAVNFKRIPFSPMK